MTPQDRVLAGVRALARAELHRLTYLGTYGYVVQRAGEGTVDAAQASSLPLPDLVGVPVLPRLLGQIVTATLGSPCRIRFVNGDPRRPVCVGLGQPPVSSAVDATGTLRVGPSAASVTLAGGSLALSREGDEVTFFLPPGSTFTGVVTLSGGGTAPLAGTLDVLNPMSGIITSGSRNVRSG